MRARVTTIVETVFTEWYSTAARWDAPGATTEFTCTLCAGSLHAAELGLAEWPHDVTHQLVATLADITRGVGELFGEPDLTLDEIVMAAVCEHAADVRDVLVECVEPRLNAFLRREAASIDSEFGLLAES